MINSVVSGRIKASFPGVRDTPSIPATTTSGSRPSPESTPSKIIWHGLASAGDLIHSGIAGDVSGSGIAKRFRLLKVATRNVDSKDRSIPGGCRHRGLHASCYSGPSAASALWIATSIASRLCDSSATVHPSLASASPSSRSFAVASFSCGEPRSSHHPLKVSAK